MTYNDMSITLDIETINKHSTADYTSFLFTVSIIDKVYNETTIYKKRFKIDNNSDLYILKCEIGDAYTGKCVANYLTSKHI